jgi:hypothetical protein
MADLGMTGTPCLADPHASARFTAIAGQAITAGYACFIHTDGLVYHCDATDHTTIADVSSFEGIAIAAATIGQPVTLFGVGSKIYLTATAKAIGTFWYIGNTEGVLSDVAVAAADTYFPVVKFITANVAEVVRAGV